MFCTSCKKLNFKKILKHCKSCSQELEMPNISVICSMCSDSNMQCCGCLKRMRRQGEKIYNPCKSCGK